jgi:hypothetical protein
VGGGESRGEAGQGKDSARTIARQETGLDQELQAHVVRVQGAVMFRICTRFLGTVRHWMTSNNHGDTKIFDDSTALSGAL